MSAGSSGEKTEKATPKKRRDERERGNVFMSRDLTTAVSLLGMFGIMRILGPSVGRSMQSVFLDLLPASRGSGKLFTELDAQLCLLDAAKAMTIAVLPFFLCAIAISVLITVVQTRFMVTGKTLAVRFNRISPISGFKRLFSSRSIMETVKSLLKIGLIIATIYGEFSDGIRRMPDLTAMSIRGAIQSVFDSGTSLAFRCGILLAGIAVIDYVYQWWKHEKDIRMTKEEVKQEYKLMEGNPETKGRIRQIQRLMSRTRMMAAVPEADVIVTNPTHYAVALRYDTRREAAPVVLAKGKGYLALKIREIGNEHKITIVENRPLARALYASVDIGEMIPARFYQAAAEVLAYVARLKKGAL
jgi:flagellar biosynthetic protein FlhB